MQVRGHRAATDHTRRGQPEIMGYIQPELEHSPGPETLGKTLEKVFRRCMI